MTLSSVFTALQLFVLLQVEKLVQVQTNYTWLFILVGVFSGLSIYFYWVPYHIFFMRNTMDGDHKYGKETGWRYFLSKIAQTLGPAIGGFIIARWGFSALFVNSILLLLAANIPVLVSINEHRHNQHPGLKVLKEFNFGRDVPFVTTSITGQGVEAVVFTVFWPVLMYISSGSFVQIGFVNSLAVFISALFCLWVGKLVDHHDNRLIHGIGVFFNTLFYLPRMILTVPLHLYTLEVIDRINSILYGLPLNSQTYEVADKKGDSNFIVFREIILHSSITLTSWFIILILPLLNNWKYVFILAALGSSLTYLINWEKK